MVCVSVGGREEMVEAADGRPYAPSHVHGIFPFTIDTSGVIKDIAPEDTMFREVDEDSYFRVGEAAIRVIESVRGALPGTYEAPQIRRILDLPCGHGRVMRFLRVAFPDAEIAACDVDRSGVDFCAETFGATPFYSVEDPREIQIEGQYDLIWCGSLFTHLDMPAWEGFLDLFQRLLAHNGILIFSVHGRRAVNLLRRGVNDLGLGQERVGRLLDAYDQHGFGFQEYPNQEGYGISLSRASKVVSMLEQQPSWRLVTYTEMGWVSFQDTVSCIGRKITGVDVTLECWEMDQSFI
jgi:SAM-dependent methyltransferase